MNIAIPLDVPSTQKEIFTHNYNAMTRGTNRLFLFAGDQRIEHLMKDFYGPSIPVENMDPRHLFTIAEQANVGAFATHMGLVARYGADFASINYIIKLNAKTDLVPSDQRDPLSLSLYTMDDVIQFKETSKLSITGVGYTIYLGSEHESHMLAQAAKIIYQAHRHGLVTILWMYPRGKYVTNERDAKTIAGAAGVATSLGADFAKINAPQSAQGILNPELLRLAVAMAGNTKLICSGGKTVDQEQFLTTLHEQINVGGAQGCAVGRNIYQRPLPQAVAVARAIGALLYENTSLEEAKKLIS